MDEIIVYFNDEGSNLYYFQDDLVYLFDVSSYTIFSYELKTGEVTKLWKVSREDELSFEWCQDILFVYNENYTIVNMFDSSENIKVEKEINMGDNIEEVNNRLKVMEVKKCNKIIVRIIVAILIVLVGILLLSNRVKGKIHVEVDDENYIVNNVACRYTDFDIEEKLISFKTLRSVVFMHSGLRYGGYEYTFPIDNEDFNVQPKILIMKTNMWDASSANIDIRIVEADGKWDAEVRVNNDKPKYFKDIEKNGIELQVGP